jgi:glutathione S-transferase
MKLLASTTSPYARKVRLVLLEKRLPHEVVLDPPREPGSQVPKVNPLGRIPALLLDDGTCVFDSPVICEYLDTLGDDPILIPRGDPLARMRVRRWEALADGVLDSAVAMRLESLRPAAQQDQGTLSLHDAAIGRALDFAAGPLGRGEWCEGGRLSLADLALASALLYLDLRQPQRDWRGRHPALADFAARMLARPSVQATLAK